MRVLLSSAFCLAALSAVLATPHQPPAGVQPDPSVDEVVHRMSQYVLAYGAQAAMFVGTERYAQRVEAEQGGTFQPRRLVSEFAIVKTESGSDWIGYRDVVEVNERAVVDRRDRLLRLLTSTSIDGAQLRQIADESARYNIGPISRNFNLPTTALSFLLPRTASRFSFKRKGAKDIDGVATWEFEFTETARPTLIRTREGRDVPASGRVWVVPGDGTVVSTRLELRNFADQDMASPAARVVVDTTTPPTDTRSVLNAPVSTAASMGAPPPAQQKPRRYESLAVVEVSFRLDRTSGAWLPSKMSETYEGAMPGSRGGPAFLGRATGVAEYSEFRRFATSAKIVVSK